MMTIEQPISNPMEPDTHWRRQPPQRRRHFKCSNCDQCGHVHKDCPEPFTSYGVIAICRAGDNAPYTVPQGSLGSHCSSCSHILPTSSTSCEMKPCKARLLYFMVQRKDTMGYTDFLRGKYSDASPQKEEQIRQFLQEMTCAERERLVTHSFDALWDLAWLNQESMLYIKEYAEASQKFHALNISELLQNVPQHYTETEWGFPKGKKFLHEKKIECACREFFEESGYDPMQPGIRILTNAEPWYENFVGTNGVKYRHIYYIAQVDANVLLLPLNPKNNTLQASEISNCAWVTYEQGLSLIRAYDTAKRDLLTRIHQFYSHTHAI